MSFVDGEGTPLLRYAGLVAFDADGTMLDAWIEATDDALHVFVLEGEARYPLTIDPFV